jgi:outer membrane protein assembly factor BamA
MNFDRSNSYSAYLMPYLFNSFIFICTFIVFSSITYAKDLKTDSTDALQNNSIRPNYDGKIIRKIRIHINDVFKKDAASFYQMANQLKINTSKEIISRELLFKKNERLNSFLIAESARVLRTLPFLREVSIVPVIDGDYVDIDVNVSDTWTLIPQVGYSSGDGRDRRTLGLAEGNLLGQGNRLETLYRTDDGVTSYEAVYDDRRLLGSDYDLVLGLFDKSDGNRYLFKFEDPFRSLVDDRAWTSQVESYTGLGRMYDDSEENFIYRTKSTAVDLSYTTTKGDPSVNLHRFSLGYRYRENQFFDASLKDIEDSGADTDYLEQDLGVLADNRRFSGPLLAYSNIEPEFVSMNYIDRFDLVQDFNLGDQFGLLMHLAPRALGSLEDTLLYGASRSKGFKFSPTSFLRAEVSAEGRASEEAMDSTLFTGEMLYYNVLGHKKLMGLNMGRHTLAGTFSLNYGHDLDADRQLSLGADTGLRGYRARTFNGDKRTLLSFEDRIHMVDDLFQLFSFGMNAFIDVGGATYESLPNLYQNELYSDVGVGLVVGFPRSSGSRVLRFDLAFPLRDYGENASAFQLRFIISGGQNFDSQLPSETINASRPSVAVGF